MFPLQISVRADSLPEAEAQHLVRLTQHALDDLNDFPGHHLRLQLASKDGAANSPAKADSKLEEPALTIRLTPGESSAASLNPQSAELDMTYAPSSIPSVNSASSALASSLADELRSTFAEEQSIISYLLSSSSISAGDRRQALTAEATEALAKRTTKSLRYSPTYHLTFSLFTDGAVPNTWDIEAAVDAYMRPMLDVLRPIHNFTIDTQVQLYATPGVQSQVLNKEHLASFINAAEWPLSPSIGGAPTVNFVVFVGNQTIELDSEAETSQSWMIPQWGTVYLLPLPPTATHVSVDTLKQPVLTFGGHLLSLLGTPQSGSLPLRLSTLARIRSTDLLLRASSSLGSLARLSLALPSISIPRSVADGVLGIHAPPGARVRRPRRTRGPAARTNCRGGGGAGLFRKEHGWPAVLSRRAQDCRLPAAAGAHWSAAGAGARQRGEKNWLKRRKQRAQEAKEKKGQ